MLMTIKSLVYNLLSTFVLLLLFGCKPSVPSNIIQPDDMEDILYDYQLADAMAQQTNDYAYNQVLYREAVLKKYGISTSEFDSSLVYYTRHTEELHKIYESLADRLRNDAMALGASESEVNRYSSTSSTGDTANVWNGYKALVLTTNAPYNVASYSIAADTTYHTGDSFLLTFRCNYIFQEGMRDGAALLAVRYANDSVASRIVRMSSSNEYTLRIDNTINQGIKEIRGYFYLGKGSSNDAASTMKLMSIYDIHLVRIRNNGKGKNEQTDESSPTNDTIKVEHVDNDVVSQPMPSAQPVLPSGNNGNTMNVPIKNIMTEMPKRMVQKQR